MVFEKLVDIIADTLNVSKDELKMETSLKDDLQADSLDVVEIIMEIENEFGIAIDDDAALNFATIADVVGYIENNQ